MLTYQIYTSTVRLVSIILVSLLAACGTGEEPSATTQSSVTSPAAETTEGTIVAVGDSLTAGYGLSEDQAYPALLEKRLRKNGYPFSVVNAGISGETSSGARARIGWVMTLNPDIVILETGANDGLRGIDPALTRENIEAIVTDLNRQGVVVVLAGMKMVKNMGREFTDAFEGVYPAIAAEKNAILIPFFLEGVAGEKALNQPDTIHPTAEGYEKVTDVVYPYVVKAIERFRGKTG
ncbi:Arylesterase precursor (EC [Olavius algarvensis associated proteobacterium Delta 3]|nr:Arylesterase precursor (EC [Olavius algarvensis associated proteobacterium Delta 3]